MKSDKKPAKITLDSAKLTGDDLNSVSGGSSGGTWARYWCNSCNCPHILDYPNDTCPFTGEKLEIWDGAF